MRATRGMQKHSRCPARLRSVVSCPALVAVAPRLPGLDHDEGACLVIIAAVGQATRAHGCTRAPVAAHLLASLSQVTQDLQVFRAPHVAGHADCANTMRCYEQCSEVQKRGTRGRAGPPCRSERFRSAATCKPTNDAVLDLAPHHHRSRLHGSGLDSTRGVAQSCTKLSKRHGGQRLNAVGSNAYRRLGMLLTSYFRTLVAPKVVQQKLQETLLRVAQRRSIGGCIC